MTKHTYRTIEVQSHAARQLIATLKTAGPAQLTIGIDVAKHKMVAAITPNHGAVAGSIKWQQPEQTAAFLQFVDALRAACPATAVAMEPTGTYGDALRQQLVVRDVPVHMVACGAVKRASELYDGVPTKHDAKDAAVIAWLHGHGKSRAWVPLDAERRDLRALLRMRELHADTISAAGNQLGALLAAAFPELANVLNVQRRPSVWKLLAQYPTPQLMAANADAVRQLLHTASKGRFDGKIDDVLAAARHSTGLPLSPVEAQLIAQYAAMLVTAAAQQKQLDGRIADELAKQPAYQPVIAVLGNLATATVIAEVGSPSNYATSNALQKACGLNLRESSSGTHQGKLHITKRGPAAVRHLLALAAIRLIQRDAVVRHWYQNRTQYRAGNKMPAVVAVMRKLVKALPHLARGAAFDPRRLFDTKAFPPPLRQRSQTPTATVDAIDDAFEISAANMVAELTADGC